jgi:hypothetical protein
MGARGARRGGRQRQHKQTGTQDALVQYYDWAWLRCPADLSEDGSKGRAQGAPSDLKMPLENERAEEERVSRGQGVRHISNTCVCLLPCRKEDLTFFTNF